MDAHFKSFLATFMKSFGCQTTLLRWSDDWCKHNAKTPRYFRPLLPPLRPRLLYCKTGVCRSVMIRKSQIYCSENYHCFYRCKVVYCLGVKRNGHGYPCVCGCNFNSPLLVRKFPSCPPEPMGFQRRQLNSFRFTLVTYLNR